MCAAGVKPEPSALIRPLCAVPKRAAHSDATVGALAASAALPALAGSGDITGYPAKIATVDLSGYKLQTFYSLGTNTGNTFDQTYLRSHNVSAVGVKGPGKGVVFTSKCITMPVGHNQLMVTWYLAKWTINAGFFGALGG